MPLPVEDDGEKESDDHDRCPYHGDPSAGDEGVEEEARNGQGGRPFFDREGKEKKFRALHDPEEQREGEEGHNPEMIS